MPKSSAIFAVAFLLLLGAASAGTVTLSGTCSVATNNSSSFNFTIANSGNDTASNLVLTPSIFGAKPSNSSYVVQYLGPGSQMTFNISVTNIAEPGAHAVYVTAVYQQGSSSVFTTLFPCVVPLLVPTASQVLLAVNTTIGSSGNEVVTALLHNGGANAADVNVSLVVPPTLTYASPKSYVISLAPYGNANATFQFTLPKSQEASYIGVVFASYSNSNMLFTTGRTLLVLPPGPLSYSVYLIAGAVALVVIVAALIVYSIFRKRRKG